MRRPLRGLRARAGFLQDLAALSGEDQDAAIDVIALVGDALDEGSLDVLDEWRVEGAPTMLAFPLAEGAYLTASVEGEGAESAVYFERAGDGSILAAPRR